MANDKVTPASAKPRTRSPSYPSIGLEEAIRRAGVLHAQFHDHAVGMEAAAEELDSNTKSSSFLQTIAALRQFGLSDDVGKGESRRIRVSDLAKDILIREEGEPERTQAIKTAALSPSIHQELWEKYGGNLPPSDSPIRVYLLRERQDGPFHPDHVDGFISQFRSTIAFAGLTADDTIPPAHEEEGEAPPAVAKGSKSTMQQPKPPPPGPPLPPPVWAPPSTPGMRQLPVTLPSSLSVAVFTVPVPMTEVDFDTLVNSLKAMKATLVEKPDPNK